MNAFDWCVDSGQFRRIHLFWNVMLVGWVVIDISEGGWLLTFQRIIVHTSSQSSSPNSPLHLGFLGAMVTWFGEMIDWIPSRGKRFVSSPNYPVQLWGSTATYSACSMDASPSGKVAGT